ncbi:unnamed protein product [Rotaria sordida]|uniref:Nuclear receptor domain-containing protein n=1 Tax=Rotaria sordida TaxID=392033 RepID=A0A814KJ82_9BILA|nr:unnamed protein product [Rotaria sordida]CAF3647666.1 unnamed protein product [Rotaria sordida]
MEKSSLNNFTGKKRQSSIFSSECKICGVPATYLYYGVISCHPCKMFFKRNAQRGMEILKCGFDNDCEINVNTRHVCSYCRLMKCFLCGMKIEKIRSSRPKPNKTNRGRNVMTNLVETTSRTLVRFNEPEQLPTVNLLRSDQSTLTIDQWNLISNLSHCYDEYSGLSIGEHYIRKQNTLPLKLRFKAASLINLYQMMLEGGPLLYKNNRDFLSLSVNDRSILLRNTIRYAAGLSANFIVYQVRLMNYSAYYDAIGILSHPALIPVMKRMSKQLDFDLIVMKLFLAILPFSTIGYTVYSNSSPENLSDIKEILRIQDSYVELLWRYLLYKYNYEQAVKLFSNLIRPVFAIHAIIHKTLDIDWITDTIDSLVQQTDQTLTITD